MLNFNKGKTMIKKLVILSYFMLTSSLAAQELSSDDKSAIKDLFKAYQNHVFKQDAKKAKALFASPKAPVTGVWHSGGDIHTAESRMDTYCNPRYFKDPIDVEVLNPVFYGSGNLAITIGEYKTRILGEVKYSGKNMWSFRKIDGKWKIASIVYLESSTEQFRASLNPSKKDIKSFLDAYQFAIASAKGNLYSMFFRDKDMSILSSDFAYFANLINKSPAELSKDLSQRDKIERPLTDVKITLHNGFTAIVTSKYKLIKNGKVIAEGKELIGLVSSDKKEWKINTLLWD